MSSRSRHGLSLIEVVASIALMSVLMVAMLTAWTKHKEQIQRAEAKLQAVTLLDQQLGSWFAASGGPPFPAEGRFPDSELIWRSFRTPNAPALPAGLLSVTVQVVDQRGSELTAVKLASTIRQPTGPDRDATVVDVEPLP